MFSRRRSRRFLILVLAVLTILAGSTSALAQGTPNGWSARALAPTRTAEMRFAKNSQLAGVIVKLDVAPLASYSGSIPGLRATSPQVIGARRLDIRSADSQRYLAYVNQKLRDFEAAAVAGVPQARVLAQYPYVFGGVALALPEDQIAQLAKAPGVLHIYRDELKHPMTDNSPQFIGAPTIWNALGGQGHAGEGVIVGVIDSGIWPEHPSFADHGMPKPPPGWTGACEPPNDDSPPIVCNNKLIGAREFLDTYKFFTGLGDGEYDSARDDNGHGTHTASTAAGNANVQAKIFGRNLGRISGIAPRAHVAAYKALAAQGGYESDILGAINQAVADGVNVINYSVGDQGGDNPYGQPIDLAFLDAYAARVFVAAAAGNDGPDPATVDNTGGWVTTVAASSTDRLFLSTLTLRAAGDTLTLRGGSISPIGVPNFTSVAMSPDDPGCLAPLPANIASGKIVVCLGNVNRVQRGYNAQQGGAVGVILVNPAIGTMPSDRHWIPAIQLQTPEPILSFLEAHTNVVGKFTPGRRSAAQGDVLAHFSSRGPDPNGQFLKPDISAPGVQILAGNTPTPSSIVDGPPGDLFQVIQGTSMSSPHIAGSGALLKALHPDWTPGQIKSALMTTAKFETVTREDGTTPADPYDTGSGRVDLTKAGNPGLTFDVTAAQYASGETHTWDLNYPSIMIPAMHGRIIVTRIAHSELSSDSVWDVKTSAPEGISIAVNPKKLTVPAHGYASFIVTIEARSVPNGTYFGSLDLTRGTTRVHMPVAFERTQGAVALTKSCAPDTIARGQSTNCTIEVANRTFQPAVVSVVDAVPSGLEVAPSSVTGASVSGNTLAFSGRLSPATSIVDVAADPHGSPAGYLPLASLGVPPLTGVCLSCDEALVTFTNLAPFSYAGQTYTAVSMVSDGYLVIGEGTIDDVRFINQQFPDPVPPNNVIAPYWTDLDLDGDAADDAGGGTWTAANVTNGTTNWFVAEWTAAAEFEVDGSAHSFQVWIQEGTDKIWMTYGSNTPTAPRLTVGAEDFNGTAGDNYYVDITATGVDGTGTAPVEGDELLVKASFTPATQTITFSAKGAKKGTYVNTAELTSNLINGTGLASATIRVR
jgi:subtilisin family serine protease